jgi:hypothetical protein
MKRPGSETAAAATSSAGGLKVARLVRERSLHGRCDRHRIYSYLGRHNRRRHIYLMPAQYELVTYASNRYSSSTHFDDLCFFHMG